MGVESVRVDLVASPEGVFSLENIPILDRGVIKPSNISAESVKEILSCYGSGLRDLSIVCEEKEAKMYLILKLADQYPLIASELEQCERSRARLFESAASEAYNGTIEESLHNIAVTKYTREGDEYTDYSAAAATHLKNRSSVLMKRAAVADRKRYGEDKEGQTINIGVQSTVNNNQVENIADLQTMSIAEIMNTQRPGTL